MAAAAPANARWTRPQHPRAQHNSSRPSGLRRRSVEAQGEGVARPSGRQRADSACARRMEGRRGNEAHRNQHVTVPPRRAVRIAKFERAIVVADARAGCRGDTPHPAARHSSFVHARRGVVGVRRSGVDRRLDGRRRSREMRSAVRRKGGAGDADAEAQRRQERGECAQPAEWFPPATSWCGSVSARAHAKMLPAPLRTFKRRRVLGGRDQSPGGGPVCACASGSCCLGCSLSACPKFRVIVRKTARDPKNRSLYSTTVPFAVR